VELEHPVESLELQLYSASFVLIQRQVIERHLAAGMNSLELDTRNWPLGIVILVAQIPGQGRLGQCRRMSFVLP
jgi:hypothetical protein